MHTLTSCRLLQKLARSAWTEFDLRSMSMGLLLIILTVIIQSWTLVKLNTICQSSDQKSVGSSICQSSDHSVNAICKIFGVTSCNILLEIFPIISLAIVAYIILKCLSHAIHHMFVSVVSKGNSVIQNCM
jgi:phosphatidylinositol glycan class O